MNFVLQEGDFNFSSRKNGMTLETIQEGKQKLLNYRSSRRNWLRKLGRISKKRGYISILSMAFMVVYVGARNFSHHQLR